MPTYQKDSMGANDAKNQKWAAALYVLGFAAVHILVFVIPAHPQFNWWRILITMAAGVSTLLLAISLWNNGDLTEDQQWPHILVIVLAFASAFAIGYCAQC